METFTSPQGDRPIQWGLLVPQGWHSEFPSSMSLEEKGNFMIQTAKEAEKAGFDAIWTNDHVHPVPNPASDDSVFECWTSLAAIARETKKVRLGQSVTCICFRNPALLAKMAATVDVLSHGRLEFGVGAGWNENEFTAYGYDFGTPMSRLERLREGIEIIKDLWTKEMVSYDGQYFHLKDAYSYPKPLQTPHPPITIGGGGEKKTLRIVASHADRSNFQVPPTEFARSLQILKKHCKAVNRDYNSIEKSLIQNIIVGKSEDDATRRMKRIFFEGDTIENFSHFNTWGSPDTIIEFFKKYRKLGVSYFIIYLANIVSDTDAIELFTEEIIPAID